MAESDDQSGPPSKRRRVFSSDNSSVDHETCDTNDMIDEIKSELSDFEAEEVEFREEPVPEPESDDGEDSERSESSNEPDPATEPEPQTNSESNVEQELTEPESSNPPNPTELKIDHLKPEVLVKIFANLDFVDLLNVANATKKLREAATQIYAKIHVDKVVKFNGDAAGQKGLDVQATDTTIEVNKARACLLMFRGFGENIEKLILNFNGIGPRRSQAISQMLNFYCAKTLIELEWNDCPADAMNDSSERFKSLTVLRMTSGCLGTSMSKFNDFFPALNDLELNDIEVMDRKCIERTFPNMTHLKVHIEPRKKLNFQKTHVKTALKLNPQIRSFGLCSGCEPKLLAFINENLPLLNTLEIKNPRNRFFDSDEDVICFKNIEQFTLDIVNCNDSFTNIPFRFKRLRKFTLNANCRNHNEWIDFVARNPKINELKLLDYNFFYVVKDRQMMQIARMPSLTDLTLDWRVDPLDILFRFLAQCPSIQQIRLIIRTQEERERFCAKIDDSWDYTIDRHFVKLQRNITSSF